jgi:hypothetical protein
LVAQTSDDGRVEAVTIAPLQSSQLANRTISPESGQNIDTKRAPILSQPWSPKHSGRPSPEAV